VGDPSPRRSMTGQRLKKTDGSGQHRFVGISIFRKLFVGHFVKTFLTRPQPAKFAWTKMRLLSFQTETMEVFSVFGK
jgi:hypothetical protein